MSHPAILASLLLALSTLIALRYAPLQWAARAAGVLRHRGTPWLLGAFTALAFWWVAGTTLDVEPISTDEASYLLQAEIFAAGRVTAPGAPIPEFFEQAWVIVSPRIYSKYPPGHALALAPGVAVGLPWLVPLVLNLVSGALLFGLLRRAIGPSAALLTWSAWVLSGMAMAWQTTYFSEVTLLACWLGGASCTWRWIDGGGARWLVGAALLIGYGAVTRPLSILLLALPLLVVVVAQAFRHPGRWADVVRAAGAGSALLLLLPAWNLATTGDVARSPLREYTETYLPWDRLGFAVESTAALRPTPPDLQAIAPQLVRIHREHTVAALPATMIERASRIRDLTFTGWRIVLLVLALIGIWRLRGPGWVVVASVMSQFLGHAIWAHQAGWTLYYAESAAGWFVPGAVGAAAVITFIAQRARGSEQGEGRSELAILLAVPWLLLLSVQESAGYRQWRSQRAGESRGLVEFVRTGPDHAIYFIHPAPERPARPGLVRNDPFLDRAGAWIVYDLGPRNAELLRIAPERQGFLVDPAARRVTPIAPPP